MSRQRPFCAGFTGPFAFASPAVSAVADCDSDPRIKRLRLALGIPQHAMADRLGLSQAAVSLMENGQNESGPVRILLDRIEIELAEAHLRAAEADASAKEAAR